MKKVILILLTGLVQLAAQAQDMREVFIDMPDSLQALLTRNNRMDMLDFLDSKMEAKVTNRLEGETVMDTLTADYLKITLTKNTVLEMKLIERGEEKVIAVLHTTAGPVKDSFLQFYTADWKEAENLMEMPPFSAFERKDRGVLTEEQIQLLEGLADMQLTEMKLSPEDQILRCQLSLDILNKEDREKAAGLVKEVEVELK